MLLNEALFYRAYYVLGIGNAKINEVFILRGLQPSDKSERLTFTCHRKYSRGACGIVWRAAATNARKSLDGVQKMESFDLRLKYE